MGGFNPRLFLSVNHHPVDFRVGRAEVMAEVLGLPPEDSLLHMAEVMVEVMAVDGGNHSLLHGEEVTVEDRVRGDRSSRRGAEVMAEVMAEDRVKDGLNHLDFRVCRVKVVEVDGHRDQCRDGHIPRRRCLGITDKRITRRGVLAAMGFLRGWGMF